jgi:DNA segregation ATPase FtsK/SpoIIIE-like protein
MLLKHGNKIHQLQAPYISDGEVRKIVSSIGKKYFLSSLHFPNRKFTILKEDIEVMLAVDETDGLLFNAAGKNALVGNKRLSDIILQVLTRNKISISELQRTLHVGFSKAKALMERLCNIGIAESPESTKPCSVIVRSFGDLTDEAVSLLTKDGYSVDDIKAVLDVKCEMIGEDQ